MTALAPTLGAHPLPDGGCRFAVWAPAADGVSVHLLDPDRVEPLQPAGDGYFAGLLADVSPGRRYTYRLDGDDLPDPASALQPEGVGGPSAVVDARLRLDRRRVARTAARRRTSSTSCTSARSRPRARSTRIVPRLDELAELGVTALELMPVAQFPGERNWGYDGVFPFAVQHSLRRPGRPQAARRRLPRGAASRSCLDVVYNHLGPEGNVLARFGPYFTDRYRTPWGAAINMDGRGSDDVRALPDRKRPALPGRVPRRRAAARRGPRDRRPVGRPLPRRACRPHAGAVRAARTAAAPDRRERSERSPHGHRPRRRRLRAGRAVERRLPPLPARAPDRRARRLLRGLRPARPTWPRPDREAFVYDGARSAFRGRRHGAPARGMHGRRFVVFSQNHDQVGNRLQGDRLAATAAFDGRQAGRRRRAARAVRAPALHGRGVRRGRAVPVLREPLRRGPDRGGAARAGAGVRGLPVVGRAARSAVGGDVPALAARWAQRTSGAHARCSRSTGAPAPAPRARAAAGARPARRRGGPGG